MFTCSLPYFCHAIFGKKINHSLQRENGTIQCILDLVVGCICLFAVSSSTRSSKCVVIAKW
jgi:hypothetical protein